MATDKNRKPKLGEAIHLSLATKGTSKPIKSCRPGTVASVVDYQRSDFPDTDLGQKQFELHQVANTIRLSYLNEDGTTVAAVNFSTYSGEHAVIGGSYHYPEECPYMTSESEHLEIAKNLTDKADNMALGSAADVIHLASAHAAVALAEALAEVCEMIRAFYEEEFGDDEVVADGD